MSADNPGAGVNKPYVEPALAGDNEAFDFSRELFTKTHGAIAAWVHGHVHDPFNYKIGSTPIYCNPHGYIGEERELDNPLKILSFSV